MEAIDASSVYDLFNFVCDPIRRVRLLSIAKYSNL